MREPTRLRDDPSSGLAAELLASARSDEPDEADRRRVAAALALAAGSATTVAAASSGSAATAAKLSFLGAKLTVGTIFVAATASVVAVQVVRTQTSRPIATVVAVPSAQHSTPATVKAPSFYVAPPPAAVSGSASAPAPITSASSPKLSSAESLAQEVVLIEAARRALRAGNAGGTLEILDRHRATFPRGELLVEATVLRIEALHAHGDVAAAKERARAFLTAHPTSAHAQRLRRLFPDL